MAALAYVGYEPLIAIVAQCEVKFRKAYVSFCKANIRVMRGPFRSVQSMTGLALRVIPSQRCSELPLPGAVMRNLE